MAIRNARFRALAECARWISLDDDADLHSLLETLDQSARRPPTRPDPRTGPIATRSPDGP
jgi:hypothetical protein